MGMLREKLPQRYPLDEEIALREIHQLAQPLAVDADLDPLLRCIGSAHAVLLGEASHGTSEYYTWRTLISKRLILDKSFRFIGVEGDWPDCYRVNRYIKGSPDSGRNAYEVLSAFNRWPTWMWANREVEHLIEWLRDYNDGRPADQKVGFFGLDVYSLWDSMRAVVSALEKVDPAAARAARSAYRCFEAFDEDAHRYARATVFARASCAEQVVSVLNLVRQRMPAHSHDADREVWFNAEQNALVVVNAERYYWTMMRGSPASWNLRDTHMADTLDRLMQFHGRGAKAIVWEHNTHIGDARATDMTGEGMVNIGQLVRERRGEDDTVLVGFGSHRGGVIAGPEWDAPMERMRVPPARPGSYESLLHAAGPDDKLLVFEQNADRAALISTPLAASVQQLTGLAAPRGHRAIGVVYDPALEVYGNYVPSSLPLRYDAFLYLDETSAVHPLHIAEDREAERREVPETFPTGV